MADECLIKASIRVPAHGLDFMTWMNTEGGRKCPQCGKYAKSGQLGWCGMRGPGIVVDMYGHLPGFGCNRSEVQHGG